MTCPKCQGEMRSYERNGVQVDQCADCRGLFLDRGELERLTEAEGSFYREPQAPQQAPRREEPRHEEHRGHGGYDSHGKHPKKRRKNFLEELFD
jgi:Zn-finger nucleic acid-binding protein